MIDSKKIIRELGVEPNKALGQNFLIDEPALERMVEAAEAKGKNVLEIGPGLGVLTDALANEAKRVAAVEIDSKMAAVLTDTLREHANTVIVNRDFLKLPIRDIEALFGGESFTVCANLPYYITSEAAVKLIDSHLSIDRMVLMMQKEAADHFLAGPKQKCYTAVSVISQHYYSVSELMQLSPSSYYPEPAVHSCVLLFERKTHEYDPLYSKTVKAAFSMRRKTLKNNIANLVGKAFAAEVIESAGLSYSARAEELTSDDFMRLSDAVKAFLEA